MYFIDLFLWNKNFLTVLLLYCHLQHHNDTIIKIDARRLLLQNIYLSLYCKGSKRVTQGLRVRGSWRSNITAIFWPQTYGRQHCVVLVLLILNRRSWGPLCWVLAFFTAYYQYLLRTPTHQGLKAPLAWCGFPYHISSISVRSSTQLALDFHLDCVI